MTTHQLRVRLFEQGIQLKDVAAELGVQRPFVSSVAHGRRRTRYVQEAIARRLGLDVGEIFPLDDPATQPVRQAGNAR